jgi:hypothetical protein
MAPQVCLRANVHGSCEHMAPATPISHRGALSPAVKPYFIKVGLHGQLPILFLFSHSGFMLPAGILVQNHPYRPCDALTVIPWTSCCVYCLFKPRRRQSGLTTSTRTVPSGLTTSTRTVPSWIRQSATQLITLQIPEQSSFFLSCRPVPSIWRTRTLLRR